jgi:hypothetical protein
MLTISSSRTARARRRASTRALDAAAAFVALLTRVGGLGDLFAECELAVPGGLLGAAGGVGVGGVAILFKQRFAMLGVDGDPALAEFNEASGGGAAVGSKQCDVYGHGQNAGVERQPWRATASWSCSSKPSV